MTIDPDPIPKVNDKVEIDLDNKWEKGIVISVFDLDGTPYIKVQTRFHQVSIPTSWYRRSLWGWRWDQDHPKDSE